MQGGCWIMSKGFLIFAVKNTGKVNYLRHAMALSASIKKHCDINQTCLITNYRLTADQKRLFDHVIDIDIVPTSWTQNVLHYAYELSPFHETIHIESDCLVQSSLDHWWTGCQLHDVLFTSRVKDFRGHWATKDYRQHFDLSELPKIYSGLYYFRKSTLAKKLHNTMLWVTNKWDDLRPVIFDPNINVPMANDEIAAISVALLELDENQYQNNLLPYPSMCHNKPRINDWPEIDLTKHIGVFLDQNFNLFVANHLQQGVWHYQNKDFLTDEILNRYVASVL